LGQYQLDGAAGFSWNCRNNRLLGACCYRK